MKQKEKSYVLCSITYSYLTIMELRLHHRQDKSCIKTHTNPFLDQLPKTSPDFNKEECSAAFFDL